MAHGATARKDRGHGDISASYSADRIGMDQPVRKAFSWQGVSWLCIGSGGRNGESYAEANRLVHPSQFPGVPTSYREKLHDSDAARADPNGFYHRMQVLHAGETLVLCGPPATFVPGETAQMDLFGGDCNAAYSCPGRENRVGSALKHYCQ